MSKTIVKNFNNVETLAEQNFAKNAKTVYAPFFNAVLDREVYFDTLKGVKGANAEKLKYDVKHGFRDKQGEYLVKGGLQAISQAKFFANHTLNELQNVIGATLGTAYKNETQRMVKEYTATNPVSKTPAKPDEFDAMHPNDVEVKLPATKTDTRTKEQIFENFLNIWNNAGHGNFWDWIEKQSDEKIAAMTKNAIKTKKAA
tara:strand:+ start:988 stop:1590 length:603 start_codon:yes stop_codon:yes gene_type:complete